MLSLQHINFKSQQVFDKSLGYIEAGLPDITGSATTTTIFNNTRNQGGTSGAITTTQNGTIALSSGGGQQGLYSMSFKASNSNGIYGKSSTVTPLTITTRYLIKY